MSNELRSAQDHFDDLDETHKKHANRIAHHLNSLPADEFRNLSNHGHASLKQEIENIAGQLGISLAAVNLTGIAWWAYKWLRE